MAQRLTDALLVDLDLVAHGVGNQGGNESAFDANKLTLAVKAGADAACFECPHAGHPCA